jgi:S-adenosylmethionine synthetase
VNQRRLFTSMAALRGHPDKLCDRISDALVDAHLSVDTEARIRAETAAAGQVVFVAVDAHTHEQIDLTGVVRGTIAETGYDPGNLDPRRCTILLQAGSTALSWAAGEPGPPTDPEMAVATEQTTVFGYACSETPERMPLPIRVAQRLAGRLDRLVMEGRVPGLGPDGSLQVTVEYEGDAPVRIDALVMQLQHRGNPTDLREAVSDLVVTPTFQDGTIGPDRATRLSINPEGPLVVGGPARSPGHTGRKQASDTYGSAARHGDGALSGKDPSRLDRCAAYAARHVATNVVAAGLATECEVMLSYTIGRAEPATVSGRTFGRGQIPNDRLSEIVRESFDLRPGAIGRRFRLWTLPRERGGHFYRDLATGGQVGRTDLDLPWEALDAVDKLQAAAARSKSGSEPAPLDR